MQPGKQVVHHQGMTITSPAPTDQPPSPFDRMFELAHGLGPVLAEGADTRDRDGAFAADGITALRDAGYLAGPVPASLGGAGASLSDVVWAQAELARHDASIALASAMHLHVTCTQAWRARRDAPGAVALLERIAGGLIVASTGGNDLTRPSARATPVDGGYQVSGRKRFVSLAPIAGAMATFAAVERDGAEPEIIGFGLPLSSPGVTVVGTWDALGMRATGSHDIVLDDVFVADAQVTARRPWDRLDPPLIVALAHAIPIISAVYLGILESLRDDAITVALAAGRRDAAAVHLAGRLDTACRTARWSLAGALADIGEDPAPELATFTTVEQAKHAVLAAGKEVVEAALELAGGVAYRKGHRMERAVRDSFAAVFHPVGPAATLVHVGAVALGVDAARL